MSFNAGSIVGTLDLDPRPFTSGLEAAKAEAAKFARNTIRVPVDADLRPIKTSLAAYRRQLSAQSAVKLGVDATMGPARRTVAAWRREVAGQNATQIKVGAATAQARRDVDALKAATARLRNVQIRVSTSGAARAATDLGSVDTAARRVDGRKATVKVDVSSGGRALTMLTLITGAVVGLSAVVGPAVAALAAVPVALSAAAQGVGALVAGFHGVGDAVKAMDAADKKSAATSAATGAARTAAANQARQAAQSLEDAQRSATRTELQGDQQVTQARTAAASAAVQAYRQTSDAERSYQRSLDSEQQAVQSLSQAREAARITLRNYRLELSGASLDEESATLSLTRARINLNKVRAQKVAGTATDLDLQEADLQARQAAQSLAEVKQANGDLRTSAAAAARAGVEGDKQVIAAHQQVTSAQQSTADAYRTWVRAQVDGSQQVAAANSAVIQAQQQAAQADADAARQVSRAQDQVRQATISAATGGSAATANLQAAMAKLTPEGQHFATFLHNQFLPNLHQIGAAVQRSMLPRMQDAMGRLTQLTPILSRGLGETGKVIGDLAVQGSKMMTSGPWKQDLGTLMAGNNRIIKNFGQSGLSLADAFRSISIAAQPMIERFSQFTEKAAAAFDKFIQGKRNTGELSTFFKRMGDALATLGHILGQTVIALWNVSTALGPLGLGTLKMLGYLIQWLGALSKSHPEIAKWVAGLLLAGLVVVKLGTGLAGLAGTFTTAARGFGVVQRAATATANIVATAATRIGATRFGAAVADLGRLAGGWVRAGAAAAASSARQVAASVRAGAVRFGGLVGSLAATAAGWVRTGLTALTSAARQKLAAIGLAIAARATQAMAVAQRILNAVMNANPIVRIIGILLLLGTALVTAYKKSTTFRNIVNGVFRAIGNVVGWVWDHILKPIVDGIKWFFDKVGKGIGVIKDIISAVFAQGAVAKPKGHARGAVVAPYAAGGVAMAAGGGLTPMAPKAQVVPPNSLRVVGDRMTGNESYIPWDHSARSLGILAQTAAEFGMKLVPAAHGGVLALAAGAALTPTATPTAATAATAPVVAPAASGAGVDALTGSVKGLTGALTPLNTALAASTTPALAAVATQGGLTAATVDQLAATMPNLTAATTVNGQRMRATWATNTTAANVAEILQTAAHTRLATNIGTATSRIRAAVNTTRVGTNTNWQSMTAKSGASVATITGPQFGGLQRGLSSVRTGFANTAGSVNTTWNRIRGYTANPIRFALQTPINRGMVPAWNQINRFFQLKKPLGKVAVSFARGGPVGGSGRGDIVPAMVDPREYVLPPAMVDALGVGNLERVRHSVLSGHTAGAEGLFAPPPGFAAGGLVGDALAWARQQQGKPYVWGATGPGAYDCSGLMSAIVGFLTGQPLYTRRFSTASFAGGREAGGFRRGLRSAFTVGVNPGQHMAGTLGGHNVESSHPGLGPRVDNGAHGSTDKQFPYQYYLPEAGGKFIPGPTGGSGFDLAGYLQRTFAAATKSANQIPGLFGAGNIATAAKQTALDAIAGATTYAQTSAALSLPGAGGGAQRWSGVAARALALLGLPPNWLGSTIRRMNQESGGRVDAVNRCLTLDAMILTRRGWRKHDEVQINDETIGYNHETGHSEWTRITAVHHYNDIPLMRIGNSRWHATTTPNHRWLAERNECVRADTNPDQCPLCDWPNMPPLPPVLTQCPECGWIPHAPGGVPLHRRRKHGVVGEKMQGKREGFRRRGSSVSRGVSVHLAKVHGVAGRKSAYAWSLPRFTTTEALDTRDRLLLSAPARTEAGLAITATEAAVLGWVAGDGNVEPACPTPDTCTPTKTGVCSTHGARQNPTWSIGQSKPHMVEKLHRLLANIPHAFYSYPGSTRSGRAAVGPRCTFRLDYRWVADLLSRAGNPKSVPVEQVLAMSSDQREAWFEAITDAEGHREMRETWTKPQVVLTQSYGPILEAIHLAAYLCGHRPSVRNNNVEHENWSPTATVALNNPRVWGSSLTREDAGRGDVWCVTTDLGSWTAEQNGQIFLTGNSDSNWTRGTPSVGLMQVIGPTYRSNVPPQYDTGPYLYGVSVNPLSNILSSMRYTMGRYGSLPAGYDRAGGYRDGGVLPPGGVAFNETTRPEAVLNASQWHDFATAAATPQAGGVADAQLRTLAQHIADAVNARPTVSVAASPTAGVRELADTVLFTLRHSGKGVHA